MQNFLAAIEHKLLMYFKDSDILGALVVATTIAKASKERVKLSNMQQWFIWTVPTLENKAKRTAEQIRELIGCA